MPRPRHQLPFENQWGPWSGWSSCSHTCGGGVSVRTRVCITRNPIEGPCPGDTRQYKICNAKECDVGSVEFRELQCAAFNDRPLVAGGSYKWTTFHGGSNPCELSCLALGHNFYYNFGRVLDGTLCETEPGAVCVNGRCLKPGCDLILGSKQQDDACMVCGGQNTTCLRHHSVYQGTGQGVGPFGYSEVAMIPAGATHIRVTDNSRNYLALQNGRSQFVINGNWRISVPGEYSVAGTKLLYRRSADTWESFEVSGPTQEDLHVMVLSTDKNPGIEYEYWLPRERYALYHGKKSPLRQPHHTGNFSPHQAPTKTTTEATTTTTTMTMSTSPPPIPTRHFWGLQAYWELVARQQGALTLSFFPSVPAGGWPALPPPQQPQPRLERDENRRNLLPQAPLAESSNRSAFPSTKDTVENAGGFEAVENARNSTVKRILGKNGFNCSLPGYLSCVSISVFRAKVLGKLYRGEETRYDVQIIHTYRNRFRLEHREFLWVPNVCDCPALEEGRQYVLMARRHINYEHTLNRILLEEDSYVQPYRPREDSLLRPLEQLCNNRGTRPSHQRRG
ncbi:ADAMTS-like protein 5-like [Scleropages formosus]|uniref:ADAMTS-like protein 5-like n=1 Tax=Scleropages formosus TaxID=113540 RepID=A0A0P7V1M9_SCLFO|nr:ADAMTS-like protein 5-like [Scleropages formosus]